MESWKHIDVGAWISRECVYVLQCALCASAVSALGRVRQRDTKAPLCRWLWMHWPPKVWLVQAAVRVCWWVAGGGRVWGTERRRGQVVAMNELQCVWLNLKLQNSRQNGLRCGCTPSLLHRQWWVYAEIFIKKSLDFLYDHLITQSLEIEKFFTWMLLLFFNIKLSCCNVLDAVPIAKHEKTSTVFGCVQQN